LIAFACSFEPGHQKESYIFGQFNKFVKDQNKKYTTIEEFNTRFENFKQNYLKLETFSTTTKSKHTTGITKFFDLSPAEFRQKYTGRKDGLEGGRRLHASSTNLKKNKFTLQKGDSLDWRDEGMVSPVKDQGQCGSCWAFSVVGNIESANAMKNGKIVQFSEQQLVSCDDNGDEGCNGGLEENAYNYIIQAGGLETEDDYPYSSDEGDDGTCEFDDSKIAVSIKSFVTISQDEDEIADSLKKYGPLSIAINASDSLMSYTGGVVDLDEDECSPQALDHAVLLVGYGTDDDGTDYWIIKNSWNTNWGEDGYFRFARGKGVCGMNLDVLTAVIA